MLFIENWPDCRNEQYQSHTTKAFSRHFLISKLGPLKNSTKTPSKLYKL